MVSAYLELTKPRITRLVMITAAAGFLAARPRGIEWLLLFHTMAGVGILAGGTNALNQWWERERDALMHRTRNRPLPSGRIRPLHAFLFGLVLGLGGILYLLAFVNPLTAALGGTTLGSYVLVYTPLKVRTQWSTLIGSVPGALPIAGGWAAATGGVGMAGWVWFAILLLWQMPHFLALGWMYREDYRRGGFAILGVQDDTGRRTGRHAVGYTALLLPVSLLPALLGNTGVVYLVIAGALGVGMLTLAVGLARHRESRAARRLFLASIAYLPLLLLVLVLDVAFV